MAAGDLAGVAAVAAACPEAPRWQVSGYAAYLEPECEASGSAGAAPLLRCALVAEAGGEIAGFAAATLLLDGEQNRCELDSMAVARGARRQGMGGELLRSIGSWAAARGARRLALEVRAGNAAALGLYQRAGLRQEGRRPRYYADPEEDALLLGMAVTSGSPAGSFSTEKGVEGGSPRC